MFFFISMFLTSFTLPSGVPLNERIIGGRNTTIEENPWQVAIRLGNTFYCGGSLISEKVVVTAAQCSLYNTPFYNVMLGTDDLNKTYITKRKVKEIIVHEDYGDPPYENDIALFILEKPVNFDSTTRAIPLAETEPSPGAQVRATGWGITDLDYSTYPDVLQTVDINIVDRKDCQILYTQCTACPPIAENMICAGVPEGGKDSCIGDSGGPITENGVLVGMVSWSVECGLSGFPGVNTNVAFYREWIREKVGV